MTFKLRAKVNFPASVTGSAGIAVTKSNGIWTIAPDFGSLVSIDPITDPDLRQIWIYTPSTGTYNVTTIAALTDAVQSYPVGTDLDMDSHKITNLADGTNNGDAINKGQADAAYMPVDATLTAIAGVTTAADEVIYATGVDTFGTTSLTAFARTILNDTDAATARSTLGASTIGATIFTAADAAAVRAAVALEPGTDVQAYNARLADIAGITYAQGDILYFDGTNLVKLAKGTDGQFLKISATIPEWATLAGGGDMLAANNLSDVADAATALANIGGVSITRVVRNITGTTDTLVLTDQGKFIYTTSGSATTITVPPNSSVAFPVGTQIDFAQYAAGKVTFAQGSGVTINSVSSLKSIAAQNGAATLVKQGTDEWLLTGYLGS